jgi:septum formation protein
VAKPFIYLASLSPRREELLTQIGVGYQVFVQIPEDGAEAVDETPLPDEPPADYVSRIARAKADAAWRALREQGLPAYPLLAADTTVTIDARILGKPDSAQDASAMLRALSGRTHRVYTAVALAWHDKIEIALSESRVTMRRLADDEVERYVGTLEPMGKAGAYAIQGRAAVFIERIEGSYSGVMGLPLFETANLLQDAGLVLP